MQLVSFVGLSRARIGQTRLKAKIAYLTAERDELEMMLDAHV